MKSINTETKRTAGRAPIWPAGVVAVFLVVAVLVVFGQTARFGFVDYDDGQNVYQNPAVERGLSWEGLGWALTHVEVANWIPLTTLSHMLDCQVFGLHAGGHHLVNVLWHAANAALLFLVLSEMTGSLWRSAFVAAVFAVHPLRAESVAWVSERKDVLSGFFFLLTIWAYVRAVSGGGFVWRIAVFLLFGLGLLAKSMVATLPLVLLLLDYWPLGRWEDGRRFWRLVWEKIPLLALAGAACVAAGQMRGLIVAKALRLPLLERVGNALVSYVVYLGQLVFPVDLATPYPIPPQGQPAGLIGLAVVLLAAISAGVMAGRKKRPYLWVGWLWYVGMLVPVIGIIQISADAAHADRYTYLPEIGLIIAGTWAVADWGARWKHRPAVMGGLMVAAVGLLAVLGYVQTSYWKDSETLWRHTLACTFGNYTAHSDLGGALVDEGKVDEGIAEYHRALGILPSYAEGHYNLGIALSKEGKSDEAMAEYRAALDFSPGMTEALNNLGIALAKKGKDEAAIAQYEKALEIEPDFIDAHYNLGNVFLKRRQADEAAAQYRMALKLEPENAEARNNLGNALAMKGANDEAMGQLRKALEIKPGLTDARENLGSLLLTQGKFDEAAVEFGKVVESRPGDVKARNNLGKALLRKGDYEGAMGCFEKISALSSDPAEKWDALGNRFLQREDLEEAILCYRQALRLNPRLADACANLGGVLLKKGETREAMDAWQEALKIRPDQPVIQNNLAWLLATSSNPALRNGAKAIALATRANELSGGTEPVILHTLAAAYAEEGNYGRALSTARRALELAMAQKKDALVSTLQEELTRYEAEASAGGGR